MHQLANAIKPRNCIYFAKKAGQAVRKAHDQVQSISVYENQMLTLHVNLLENRCTYGVAPGPLPKYERAALMHRLTQLSEFTIGTKKFNDSTDCMRPCSASNMFYVQYISNEHQQAGDIKHPLLTHINGLSQSGITNGTAIAYSQFQRYIRVIQARQAEKKETKIALVGKGPVSQHLIFLFSKLKYEQEKGAGKVIDFDKLQLTLTHDGSLNAAHDNAAKLIHPKLGSLAYPLYLGQLRNILSGNTPLVLTNTAECRQYLIDFLSFKAKQAINPMKYHRIRQRISDLAEYEWLTYRQFCKEHTIEDGYNANGFMSLPTSYEDRQFLEAKFKNSPEDIYLNPNETSEALGNTLDYPHGAFLSPGGAIHQEKYENAVQKVVELAKLPLERYQSKLVGFNVNTDSVILEFDKGTLKADQALLMPGVHADKFSELKAPHKVMGISVTYQ